MGRLLTILAALSWIAGAVPPAQAADLQAANPQAANPTPPLVLEYRIESPVYGDIGSYTNSIEKAGRSTTVHTTVHVLVKVLGIVMYRGDTARTEHWQGDRLISFRSATQKNGRTYDVTGEAQGGAFVVTGPAGTFHAPADVQPPNPWSARCLKSNAMLSSLSGRIFPAHIRDRGQDVLSVAGQKYRAHEYQITTDRPHLVWFDDLGVPLQIEATEEGQPVRLTLSRYPEPAQIAAAGTPR
jgi:hypothetical protein